MLVKRKKLKVFMIGNTNKRFGVLEWLANLDFVQNLYSPIGGFMVWPIFFAVLLFAAFYDVKTVIHQAASPVSAQVAELHRLKITGSTVGDRVTGLVSHKQAVLP